MKKTKALLLALVLCMMLALLPGTASAVEIYTDVDASDWYYDAVMFCRERNLMIGVSDSEFGPESSVTRAMAATVIYRMMGFHEAERLINIFSDVPNGEWYTEPIKWMTHNTLTLGYGGGLFGPNDPVTREQFAVMIYRAGYSTGKLPAASGSGKAFNDLNKASDWAYDNIVGLNKLGVLSDLPGNSFRPGDIATRGEIASILQRYCQMMDAANGIGGYEGHYGEDFWDDDEWHEYQITTYLYRNEAVFVYYTAGMRERVIGTSEIINGEKCWKVVMGWNRDDGFTSVMTYAVGLDSGRVYRYHEDSGQWYPPETWSFDEG